MSPFMKCTYVCTTRWRKRVVVRGVSVDVRGVSVDVGRPPGDEPLHEAHARVHDSVEEVRVALWPHRQRPHCAVHLHGG
eukprot:2771526-Pyramimonas_sp.AAC.3